jgi:hypothetical protein
VQAGLFLGFVADRFNLIHAVGTINRLAGGIVADECDAHISELSRIAGPFASDGQGKPPRGSGRLHLT